MNGRRLLLVRLQSPLRMITLDEPLTAFSDEDLRLPRGEFEIDTRPLDESVEGGHWRSSDLYVRRTAEALKKKVSEEGGEVHYFGIAEVPHTLGLGAYLGDETHVHVHDYDRDTDTWKWPEGGRTLEVDVEGTPREKVSQAGEITLVVEVSYPIDQVDVDDVVGDETLASIRIRPAGRRPTPGIVRSAADVLAIRESVREVLGAIAENRPSATLIHLFIAAPMSVCFAVGQELRLRNGRDVQTYRFRTGDPERYKAALLLTARDMTGVLRILTDGERELAAELRSVFREALDEVKAHAGRIPDDGKWYAGLEPAGYLQSIAPFPQLRPISMVVDSDDEFGDVPRDADYAFRKEPTRRWEMSDQLVLSFYDGADRDRERMRQLARLFYYHEYLHDWQTLTKYTAEDVGSFANSLEAIDYMADSYALLHQIDFAIRAEGVSSEKEQKRFLTDQIGLAIASFWAFEPTPPNYEWQERRLRRYLNWYWRKVQVREAPTLRAALRTLARRPSIEIVGFVYRTGGGRHYVLLNKPRAGDVQEIGVVLEDGRFMRRGTSTDLSIQEVMRAFGEQDRDAIDRFFNSLMEHAKQSGAYFAEE